MWVDSGFSFSQGWDDHDSLIARAKEWDGYVTTTGYLQYEDPRCVVIAQSRDGGEGTEPGEPRWAAMMLINRANILSIEPLIPMSACPGSTPTASAPATSSEESPVTLDGTTPADALRWCVEHRRHETKAGFPVSLDTETRNDAEGAQRPAHAAPGDSEAVEEALK
jgi:hypothetical protein